MRFCFDTPLNVHLSIKAVLSFKWGTEILSANAFTQQLLSLVKFLNIVKDPQVQFSMITYFTIGGFFLIIFLKYAICMNLY